MAKMKPPQIFLCHSHVDKPFVRKLSAHLSYLGVHVWMDEWVLQPGDSLHGCIGQALQKVAYLGVVLSPDSVSSNWCKSELEEALTREKSTGEKIAIPLLYRRVSPPPFLAGRLYVDFRRSYFKALSQLTAFLHSLPVRPVAEAMLYRKPKTLDETIACLEAAGWKGIKYINSFDYVQIQKIFKKAGVDLKRDEFELILHRKQGEKSKKAKRYASKLISPSDPLIFSSDLKESSLPNFTSIFDIDRYTIKK